MKKLRADRIVRKHKKLKAEKQDREDVKVAFHSRELDRHSLLPYVWGQFG